jgi:drug/metabolite transporter (DMT)-like permease
MNIFLTPERERNMIFRFFRHMTEHRVAQRETGREFSPLQLGLLLVVTVGWGLNWPVMKTVLSEVPPLSFRGFCLSLGGLGLLLLARMGGQRLMPPRGKWPTLVWLASTNILGWNVLMIYGVSLLPSGRAALLGYTMPVWSLLLSALWLGDKLTPRRLLGLTLGGLGVFAMMGMELFSLSGAPLGVLLMLGSAFSWAVGVVSIKRFPVRMALTAFSGWLMVLGGLPIALAALALELPRWQLPGLWPALGLAYNVFISFMLCSWAWNRIVLRLPVAVSSLSSLLAPLIGVLGGMWLLGEKPGWSEGIGAACILGAVATVVLRGQGVED